MLDYKQPREFKDGALSFRVRWVLDDETPDLSHLEQDYACARDCGHKPGAKEHVSAALNAKYKAQDAARLAAYQRDEWSMLGCLVEVRIETSARWHVTHEVGRASLWGIESDSDDSYFKEVERDLIDEARNDARETKAALKKQLV